MKIIIISIYADLYCIYVLIYYITGERLFLRQNSKHFDEKRHKKRGESVMDKNLKPKNYFKPEDFDAAPLPEPEENLYNVVSDSLYDSFDISGSGISKKVSENFKITRFVEKKREKQ